MAITFAFEGLDGLGKSTLIDHVERALSMEGYNVVTIVEPGTTFIGNELRRLVKEVPATPFTQLLMMFAARADLYTNLPKADIILSDRCWVSTIAYQLTASPTLYSVTERCLAQLQPKVPNGALFILDGDLALAKQRKGGPTDVLEDVPDTALKLRERFYKHFASGTVPANIPEYECSILDLANAYRVNYYKQTHVIDANEGLALKVADTVQAIKALL
jgi:dTMP kinase